MSLPPSSHRIVTIGTPCGAVTVAMSKRTTAAASPDAVPEAAAKKSAKERVENPEGHDGVVSRRRLAWRPRFSAETVGKMRRNRGPA